ncbi:MAG TPA: CvpA family protein [Caulifigura sp.]|nr:CvpA family protein [Caulifigura sp.]
MIDLLLLAIIGVVTYCVASEGPWGAATTFVAVILAGLLAMNFFEPLAGMFPAAFDWQMRADIIALLGLFAAGVTGLRMAAEYLMPTQIEVSPIVYDGGRWGFGLLTGYATAAIVLTALHTAPLGKDLSLGFRPNENNFFGIGGVESAPDRLWLSFTQYVSENIFTTGNVFDRSEFPRYRGKPPEQWSSFPIRYADRRQRYASGAAVASSAPGPGTGAPPIQTMPTGVGGGSKF